MRSREVKTLGGAWRAFLRRDSPRYLAGGVVAALVVRVALGDWGWWDAASAVALLLIYPFGEWAIHVYLLHLKPFRFRGRRVELPTARAHRQHHEAPNDLGMVLLDGREVLALLGLAVPFVVALGAGLVTLVGGTV